MRRFAITPERVVDGRVTFDAVETRHLARVLRLGPGDTVVASDGAGHDYTVRLDAVRPRATGVVVGMADAAGESPLAITLVQGLSKGDKLETIVRAATELGVARIVPALTARTVVRLAERESVGRLARWQRVPRADAAAPALVALPQSRRGDLGAAPAHEPALRVDTVCSHSAKSNPARSRTQREVEPSAKSNPARSRTQREVEPSAK